MNILKLQLLMNQTKVNNSNLASMSGVSDVTISKILNGADAKISTIEKIAEALKVPVGYFFDDSTINQANTGNSNVVVGRDNNGHISMSECQDRLEDALLEIKHLKELNSEKERLIQVLLSKHETN